MSWIDMHTHYHMLEVSVDEALETARRQNVKRSLTIGTEEPDWPKVCKVAEKYFPEIAGTIGLHPHEAKHWNSALSKQVLELAKNPYIVGLGEMGFDYYYKNSTPEEQARAFNEQMQIAQDLNLPVEIHSREAEADTAEVLKKFSGKVHGLLHCFTSSKWLAEKAIDYGFDLSFSGVVTFKNADELREIAKWVPSDRMHVETDAPFLAPVPQRGKKNQPAFVIHTAEFVADLRGISHAELSKNTWENARRLFPKWNL